MSKNDLASKIKSEAKLESLGESESTRYDSERTRHALQKATIEVIKEQGILNSVNAQDIADRANVNRALVYHYFGSRQDLVRSALKTELAESLDELQETNDLAFPKRARELLRLITRHEEGMRLLALFVLDGGSYTLMPAVDDWRRAIKRDQDRQEIRDDFDITGMIVLISCLAFGFGLFRRELAKELGMSTADFDWLIDDALAYLLNSVKSAD